MSASALVWPAASVTRARAVVDTLTSDAFAGRGYDAADGAARAAQWAAARMAATPGVRPLGRPAPSGAMRGAAFLHPFAFDAAVVARAGLAVGTRTLALGADAWPVEGVGAGEGEAAAVDVGAGPDSTGADAAQLRARVAVLSAPSAAGVEARIARAVACGAVAVVVLVDALPPYGRGERAAVPVFLVRRAAWAEAIAVAGSIAGPAAVRYRLDVPPGAVAGRPWRTGHNVVGVVAGRAVPDSFVVVTAHLDHLGRVDDAFTGAAVVFRGANDNASGSAAALALLDTLARRPLRYSVVVVLTGAEEQGLLGAEALAASPLWPLARTRLLLNLDMLGSGATGTGVFGGLEEAALFARMQATASRVGAGPLIARGLRPNSDHFPFARRGVPAVFLIAFGGAQPYHSPGDVAASLEWDDWASIVALTYETLRRETGG